MGAVAALAAVAGAAVNAYGAYSADKAAAHNAAYQSQVARNNAAIARQNVAWVAQAGEAKVAAEGMRTRAAVGAIKAAQGAGGIDVNTGSAASVRASRGEIGALDAMTIRSNAAREAYGYETAATSDIAQAGLYSAESSQASAAAPWAALGTFLSGASSVGGKYAAMQDTSGNTGSASGSDASVALGLS